MSNIKAKKIFEWKCANEKYFNLMKISLISLLALLKLVADLKG